MRSRDWSSDVCSSDLNDARAVAAMVHVTQFLDFRIAILRHRLEAALTESFKRGLELRKAFQRRAGTHMFIMVQHHFAYPILDRHNRALEAAFFPALGGATLALHCKIVDILQGVAVDRCDNISAYALRLIMIGQGDLRIGSPRAAIIDVRKSIV